MTLSLKILKATSAFSYTEMSSLFWFSMGCLIGGTLGLIITCLLLMSDGGDKNGY